MNLRKSSYFKPLCLLVAALFTTQCITYERKLISTEEKVIENGIQAYVYELEKIKMPTAMDPTIEYRVVKFPANRADMIYTFKIRKIDRSSNVLLGFLAGAVIGTKIGIHSMHGEFLYLGRAIRGFFMGSIIGISGGIAVGGRVIKNSATTEEIKKPVGSHFIKKSGSIAIPIQYFPLEFKWGPEGKGIAFKTRTDERGIVRINLIDDLKMTKVPPDHPLILYIHYLNPESKLKSLFTDSLGPEK